MLISISFCSFVEGSIGSRASSPIGVTWISTGSLSGHAFLCDLPELSKPGLHRALGTALPKLIGKLLEQVLPPTNPKRMTRAPTSPVTISSIFRW